MRSTVTALRSLLPAAALLLVFTLPAAAQISPGDLAEPHSRLEGVSNCVKCHELGKGPSDRLCLDCHREIDQGLREERGYHHRLMTGGEASCVSCHTDHNGREFQLVHWPEGRDRFDHALTGYRLAGAHADLTCRQCHRPENVVRDPRALNPDIDLHRTFLGLGSACLDCHEDRHRGQLNSDCSRCHEQKNWKPARFFDHEFAEFRLTGLHRQVACSKCHLPMPVQSGKDEQPVTRYTGLAFGSCIDCHRDDVHRGRLGNRCEQCHRTEGWLRVEDRAEFDHSKTAYPLKGRHRTVECRECHTGASLTTRLPHDACTDCHDDEHRGQFAGRPDGGRCESCHDLEGFVPARFDLAEHRQSPYPLTGAHTAVPCSDCHQMEPLRGDTPVRRFRMAESACHDCHEDEHRGQFPPRIGEPWCESCHDTSSWRDVRIDHDLTRFPLEGRHGRVDCSGCHPRMEQDTDREHTLYKPLELVCTGCHVDIHRGQFATAVPPKDCIDCHTPEGWKPARFDHDRDARFSLRGAHERVPCAGCHGREDAEEPFTRYRPLSSGCADCHRGDSDAR